MKNIYKKIIIIIVLLITIILLINKTTNKLKNNITYNNTINTNNYPKENDSSVIYYGYIINDNYLLDTEYKLDSGIKYKYVRDEYCDCIDPNIKINGYDTLINIRDYIIITNEYLIVINVNNELKVYNKRNNLIYEVSKIDNIPIVNKNIIYYISSRETINRKFLESYDLVTNKSKIIGEMER